MLSVWFRTPLELDIIKDRNRLYLTTAEGFIENIYNLRIVNKDQQAHTYAIDITGHSELVYQGPETITVAAGAVITVPVRVSIDPFNLTGTTEKLTVRLQSVDDESIAINQGTNFIGPVRRR